MRSLEEGTLTQSSKTPTQLFLLPALRTAELTTYQCLWFPTRPLGIVPPQWSRAPLETRLSLSHSHSHPRTPCPPPRLQQPRGKREGSLGARTELAEHPPKARTTRSSATPTTTPRHQPGERPGPSPTPPQSSSPTTVSQYFNPFRQTSQALGVG